MKRFQFRLERLLNIREHHEREWEVRFAQASRICNDLEGKINGLSQERAVTIQQAGVPTGETEPLDVGGLLAREHYLVYLDRRASELTRTLAAREIERDEVRQKLSEASRAKKVLEKLRERRSAEYGKDSLRHAAKVLDEVAGSGTVRRRLKGES